MSLPARSLPFPYRVVVADSYAATRDVLTVILSSDRAFHVSGMAASVEDAMRLIRETAPDVLVIDPWLLGPAGLPGCLKAKQLRPGLVIVALLPEEREEYPRAAKAMGCDAAVAKRRVGSDLLPALHEVLDLRE